MQRTVSAIKRDNRGIVETTIYNVQTPRGEKQVRTYRISNYPTVLLLDQQGTVQRQLVGLLNREQLQREVDAVLERSDFGF
jgi:hypothetical protein